MEKTDGNILAWEEKFNKYTEFENKINLNINNMNEIKNNLKKLLGNQKKDDIVFYKSIIDNLKTLGPTGDLSETVTTAKTNLSRNKNNYNLAWSTKL